MKRIVVSVAFAGLLAVPIVNTATGNKKAAHTKTSAASGTKPASPPTSGDWHPASNLVSSLGGEVVFGAYAMRVPEGYSEVSPPPEIVAQQQSHGFDSHVYFTDKRSNGTRAGLYTTVATPPPGMAGALPLDEALQGAMAQKKHQWHDFVESKPEQGQMSGLTFERAYFKGIYSGPTSTRLAHGFAYVTEDVGKIISIVAEDSEPYSGQTLPVAEAATLTFHKQ